MTALRIPFFLCLSFAVLVGALAAADLSQLLDEANAHFRAATDLASKDEEVAKERFRQAILRYEQILDEGEVQNGKLHYNLGNAYFMTGDIGHAILHYRRAETYNPHDLNLKQNLAYARSQRTDEVAPESAAKILRIVFFWHYDLPYSIRFGLFAVCFALVWAFAIVRLFVRASALSWCIGITLALSALFGSSIVTSMTVEAQSKAAVVVVGEVTARKGDSESYQPSFEEPLHSGMECEIVEQRNEWLHVELPDGRRCWLPQRSLERV
jgi:tetratricopeptide repeat protein